MSGKKSREKGKRGEREFAKLAEGIRIWYAAHDVFAHDRPWEVKFLSNGLTTVYKALEEYEAHAEPDDPPPIVAARQTGKRRWIVVQYYEDWLNDAA